MYDDITFDGCYVEFTIIDQIIPSPVGMIAFEELRCDYAKIFMNYNEFETVTDPDFTGERVLRYIKLRDIATNLKHFKKTFPSSDEFEDSGKDVVGDFYDQCPPSFNDINTNASKNTCHELQARQLHPKCFVFGTSEYCLLERFVFRDELRRRE